MLRVIRMVVIAAKNTLMRGAKNGTYIPKGYLFNNKYILMLPLAHIFGSVSGFLSCIYAGDEIYGCNDVKRGLVSIPEIKPTLLVLVLGIAELVFNLAGSKGEAFLGDLKCIITGGAAVPERLIKEAKGYGIDLFHGYGMTEGANFTSANVDIDTKPHSIGKIYPGQEYKTVDGELWIREEVKRINKTLPSFKQISKVRIRTEDFKRNGALKIDRRDIRSARMRRDLHMKYVS